MAPRKTSAALGDFLTYLEWEGYTTEAQTQVRTALSGRRNRKLLARDLIKTFCRRADVGDMPTMELVRRFLGFLVFLVGRDLTLEAFKPLFAVPEPEPELGMMAEALDLIQGMETPPELAQSMRQLGRQMIGPEALAQMEQGDEGIGSLLEGLLDVPVHSRRFVAEALLAEFQEHAKLAQMLSWAVLFPYDDGTLDVFLQGLLSTCGDAGAAYLERLGPNDVGDAGLALFRRALIRVRNRAGQPTRRRTPIKGAPPDWPVQDVRATPPDGQGSQGIYLVRQRSPRRLALVGFVLNDERGIVDAVSRVQVTPREWRDTLEHMAKGTGGAFRISVAHACSRLESALAISRAGGYPLPLAYLAARYLMAGLAVAGAPRIDQAGVPHHQERRSREQGDGGESPARALRRDEKLQ